MSKKFKIVLAIFLFLLISFFSVSIIMDFNCKIKLKSNNFEYISDDNYNIYNKVDSISFKLSSLLPARNITIQQTSGSLSLFSSQTNFSKTILIDKIGLVVGKNIIEIKVKTFFGRELNKTFIINNYSELNTSCLDTNDDDGDKLLNYQELLFGTNISAIDSDDDGISDYDEIFKLSTNPNSKDSNNNGILDNNEDEDGDGLVNSIELVYNSSVFNKDTDNDGLSDYDEINVYNTNPNLCDSDADGINDYDEIYLSKTDPLIKNNLINLEVSSDDENVKISINNLKTENYKKIIINKNEKKYLDNTIIGYLDGPYEITSGNDFENAIIKFKIDEIDLKNTSPTIYYYDEEKQILEEQNTEIINGYAIATVKHFSTYVLLNKIEFDKLLLNRKTIDITDLTDSNNDLLPDTLTKAIIDGKITTETGINPLRNVNYEDFMSNNDYDCDGLLNGKEIEFVMHNDLPYIKVNSNPLTKDSDNDGIQDKFDLDPLETFDSTFKVVENMSYIPQTDLIDVFEENSDRVYNTVKAAYNEYENTLIRAYAQKEAFSFMPASDALDHFLYNSGKPYNFDNDWGLLNTYSGKENLAKNTNSLIGMIEGTLKDGATSTFATVNPLTGTNYGNHLEDLADVGWWYAVGTTSATMVANATRKGDNYKMLLTYRIVDFYDWEKNADFISGGFGGLINDGEMYDLHTYGVSRQYRITITYNMEITWVKGDRYYINEFYLWDTPDTMNISKITGDKLKSSIKSNSHYDAKCLNNNKKQEKANEQINDNKKINEEAKINNNKISSFRLESISKYSIDGIESIITTTGEVDLKNQIEHFKTSSNFYGISVNGEGYLDLKNNRTYTYLSNKWVEAEPSNSILGLDIIMNRISNDKSTISLGNNQYKVIFNTSEIDKNFYGFNSISSGDIDGVITLDNDYITEISFDFSNYVSGFEYYYCNLKLYDYNKVSGLKLPNISK